LGSTKNVIYVQTQPANKQQEPVKTILSTWQGLNMKLSHMAAALLLASSSTASFAAAPTTFVHLFEWRWSDF